MANNHPRHSGLCCEKYTGELYTVFMMQIMEPGEEGEVLILDGKMRGSVCDGVTIYPTEIIERIPVKLESRGNLIRTEK